MEIVPLGSPEIKTKIRKALDLGGKPAEILDLLKEYYPENRKEIDAYLKVASPEGVLGFILDLPTEFKSPTEAALYPIKRVPEITKERYKETARRWGKVLRGYKGTETLKDIALATLSTLGIPFAPFTAIAGEPTEEILKRAGAPKILQTLGGMGAEIAATAGLGAGLKAAQAVPKLAKVSPQIAKLIGEEVPETGIIREVSTYAKHLAKVKPERALPEHIYESITNKVQEIERLKPQVTRVWKEIIRRKHLEDFAEEFDEATRLGEFKRGMEAYKKLKGGMMEGIEEVAPELAEKVRRIVFSEDEMNAVMSALHDSSYSLIQRWEIASALRDVAIGKKLPEKKHLKLLSEFLGLDEKAIKNLVEHRSLLGVSGEANSFSRAIIASGDASGIFRQGIMAVGRPELWKNIPVYFRSFFSAKQAEKINEMIIKDPLFPIAVKSKLPLTNILTSSEEYFISNLAHKVPLIGKLVEASDRGYTTFLNKVRFDLFKYSSKKLHKFGNTLENSPEKYRSLAEYIGAQTGRGPAKIVGLGRTADLQYFFAPRLVSSRLYFLNPIRYWRLPQELRGEYLRDMLSFVGFGTALVGLAHYGLGAKVVTNPKSADFMQIKIGDTRIDPWGGFRPWVVLLSRLADQGYVAVNTGKEYDFGEGFKKVTAEGIIAHFIESKLSPLLSFVTYYYTGRDFAGMPFDMKKQIVNFGVPIVFQNLIETISREPQNFWTSAFDVFGMGVNTYSINEYYRDIIPRDKFNFVNQELRNIEIGSFPIKDTIHAIPITPEEQEKFRRIFGTLIFDQLDNLFRSENYQKLDLLTRHDTVNNLKNKTMDLVIKNYFPTYEIARDLKTYISRLNPKLKPSEVDKKVKKFFKNWQEMYYGEE